jgi:hypothetical protein
MSDLCSSRQGDFVPNIDFEIRDGEWVYEGTASYTIRRGDKGDRTTPPVSDAVDSLLVLRVDAYGPDVGMKTLMCDVETPRRASELKATILRSSLLMERLEELCQEDLERGSDAN